MFIRVATLLPITALAAVVAAAPGALEARTGSSQCNTSALQCCNSTQQSTPTALKQLGVLLGSVLPVDGLIGFGCTPITVVGVGSGATCTAQTLCCTDTSFNGLIYLGCSPIDLDL